MFGLGVNDAVVVAKDRGGPGLTGRGSPGGGPASFGRGDCVLCW